MRVSIKSSACAGRSAPARARAARIIVACLNMMLAPVVVHGHRRGQPVAGGPKHQFVRFGTTALRSGAASLHVVDEATPLRRSGGRASIVRARACSDEIDAPKDR